MLKFCKQVDNGSGIKHYLLSFIQKGQNKDAKAFKVEEGILRNFLKFIDKCCLEGREAKKMSLIIFESRNVGPFNVLSNYSVVHRKEEFPAPLIRLCVIRTSNAPHF